MFDSLNKLFELSNLCYQRFVPLSRKIFDYSNTLFTADDVCGILTVENGGGRLAMKYYKLFDLLTRRGMTKTDLRKAAGFSTVTLAKLSKGESVTTDVIEKICVALGVQPGDIMEIEEPKEG